MRMQKGPRFLRELARGTVGGAKKRRLRVQQSQRRVAGMAKAAAGDSYRRRRRKRLAAVGWTHKKNRLGFLYTVRTTLYGMRAYTEPQTVEVSSPSSSPLFRMGEALFRGETQSPTPLLSPLAFLLLRRSTKDRHSDGYPANRACGSWHFPKQLLLNELFNLVSGPPH